MRIPSLYTLSAVLILSGSFCVSQAVIAASSTTSAVPAPANSTLKDAVFTQEQLDQMLAPIALYPDPLLAQILMASTYPGEFTEAVAWSKANPNAKGDDAVKQVQNKPWDPSVQALVAFPQVLATLGQDPVAVQRLGDAFLAQPDDLMAAVQRLRHQAQAAGNLQSNQYQNVTVQNHPAPAATSTEVVQAPASTIIIQPADPQVVYVPTYNPTTTYGTWPYPASPPAYYPPPPAYYPGQALLTGLAFGAGVAIVGSLWGDCDWGNSDVDIDVERYNNINGNNRINVNQNKFQHNAAHRNGVPYRDSRSREQYGRQLNGASQREAYRGDTPQRAQQRENARSSMDRAGIERPPTTNREARDQARDAQARGVDGNRAQGGTDRDAARQNAANRQRAAERQGATDRQQAANRGQGTDRTARDGQQPRKQTADARQRQGNAQARQTTKSRPTPQAASKGSARNNAFAGTRSPSQANAQANRGRASQASAQRQNASRGAGKQVSRPANPPARQSQRGGRR
jgi:hypothetical protein